MFLRGDGWRWRWGWTRLTEWNISIWIVVLIIIKERYSREEWVEEKKERVNAKTSEENEIR